MNMDYCMHCGEKLIVKPHPTEGPTPWCPVCGEYRFPVFSTAVSMIVTNPARDRILLIKQYGRPFYILVAGYVTKGEDAEQTVVREIREELDMSVVEYRFNKSRYFAPTNTLMLNFTAVVAEAEPRPNEEVDAWRWFTLSEARTVIKPDSLAREFLFSYLDSL